MGADEWPCSPLQLGVLVAMCLQSTIYTLVRRYSLITGEPYNAQAVLLVGEMIKLAFSAAMTVRAEPEKVVIGSPSSSVCCRRTARRST